MLFDWFLDLLNSALGLLNGLPDAPPVPSGFVLLNYFFTLFGWYVPIAPIVQALLVVIGAWVTIFLPYRVIIFVYNLIPFVR